MTDLLDTSPTIVDLSNGFQEAFQRSVTELSNGLKGIQALEPITQGIEAFSLTPGKHLRPTLFLWGLSIFGKGAQANEALLSVACAQEHFHNFLLIHDDVIDASASRRGKPSFHQYLIENFEIDPQNARHLAIITGNVIYSFALEAFLHPDLNKANSTEALRYFLRIAGDTGIGEITELLNIERPIIEVSEGAILNTYDLKTSRYTFEAPLALAAILSDRRDKYLEALRKVTSPIGVAFQIENDLHEIDLSPEAAAEKAFDLRSGIKTLYLRRAFGELNHKQRSDVEGFLALKKSDASACAEILSLLDETGVRSGIESAIADCFERSRLAIEQSDIFSATEKAALAKVVAFIHSKRKHSESKTAKI